MPQHAAPSGLPAAILARLQQGAGGSALPLAPVPRGGAGGSVFPHSASAPAPGADSALIRGLLAVLPHDRGAPRAPAPRGGARPSAPLAPIKWDFDVMGALIAVARFLRSETAAAAADAAPSRKRPAASDDAATHAAKRPAPPPRCYCDRPAVRLGDRFVCPLPDTRNYCTFGREDRMRIVPRFGIPAALAPKLD